MQRRAFMAMVAGGAALAAPRASGSTLDPQSFIANFRAQALRLGRPIEWVYAPGPGLEPFLDFYPGDQWVSSWALSHPAPSGMSPVNARAFAAEAARRGRPLRSLA